MKHKMKLVLGDWSGDGHGKYETKTYECNVPVEAVQEAYKASCKLTGIQFNHNQDILVKASRVVIHAALVQPDMDNLWSPLNTKIVASRIIFLKT